MNDLPWTPLSEFQIAAPLCKPKAFTTIQTRFSHDDQGSALPWFIFSRCTDVRKHVVAPRLLQSTAGGYCRPALAAHRLSAWGPRSKAARTSELVGEPEGVDRISASIPGGRTIVLQECLGCGNLNKAVGKARSRQRDHFSGPMPACLMTRLQISTSALRNAPTPSGAAGRLS